MLGLKGRALWASLEGLWSRTIHDFILRGVNLTDKLAFNSVSRFRDAVPLPGRDVSFNYRLAY